MLRILQNEPISNIFNKDIYTNIKLAGRIQ